LFRVKICGITELRDLELAAQFGADAAGFNFFRKSPRYLDVEICREITGSTRSELYFVGVFVNENPDNINRVADYAGLTCVQLSGNEGAEMARKVERETIKVIRAKTPDDVRRAGDFPSDWIMFDTPSPGEYGGSGRTFNHEVLIAADMGRPFLLAGGLTPDNVSEIIKKIMPFGVDVASGVERSPGLKDPKKMQDFINNAREALRIEG
jgi:phosphoribosylanthranilate isomerase